MLHTYYFYSSIRVRYKLLCINQRKYIKTIIWDRENEIILFNIQRLEITTFAGQRSANLVGLLLTVLQVHLLNTFSHNHLGLFKGREGIVWEKRG
jgi:hypothetical protein